MARRKVGNMANGSDQIASYSWEEIRKHTGRDDKWIVINGEVYDISQWQKRHPGGARIISHFAGQDATDAVKAVHTDHNLVNNYMKTFHIGSTQTTESPDKETIRQDFRKLRETMEKMNLFSASPLFFLLHFGHIVALEILALYIFYAWGTGWIPYIAVIFILATSQAQAGWTQHDYGHLSVCPGTKLNHFLHQIVIGHLKGASSHWWNFRHNQHHVKPNNLRKDPDVAIAYVFLLGNTLPVQWGKAKRGFMPYNWQHLYFWFIGPPMLLPFYFHLEVIYFIFKRKDFLDLAFISTFFMRFLYSYTSFMTVWQALGMYMLVRVVESFWFTLVTQINHIPMEIDSDQNYDWATAQTVSTCNVDPSFFNDWFTGHLNYQIEHHFFPTMPRHSYKTAMPLVKSFCQKHRLPYISKSLSRAIVDVPRSLEASGKLWSDAYYGS